MLNSHILRNINAIRADFQNAQPFQYTIIDRPLEGKKAQEVLHAFPDYRKMQWHYDESRYPLEPRKAVIDGYALATQPIRSLMDYLGSSEMIKFLSQITDLENLFIDHTYHGGFLHQSPRGGKLGIHLDREIHKNFPRWKREVTLIIYFNENWLDEWNGDLQFWSGLDKNGFQLKECVAKIFPSFNRMVIFRNTTNSYHGFPDRIECPPDVTRKAIVAYYYLDSSENEKMNRTGGRYFLRSSDEVSSETLQYIEKRSSGYTPIS